MFKFQSSQVFTLLIFVLLTSCGKNSSPVDSTPEVFRFVALADVAIESLVESSSITVSGIDQTAEISISGGAYQINNEEYTSLAGTVSLGQTVRVRLLSSINYETTASATLTIGGVSADFQVTTIELDSTPDNFSFVEQSAVPLNTPVLSSTVSVSGVNGPAPISITGGEYQIDNGEFTSQSGSINSDQQVIVRLLSSGSFLKTSSSTLTIGGVSASFEVTTERPSFFFHADNGENGMEVWGTDGTENGTQMISDYNTDEQASLPNSLVEFNGSVYLFANDGKTGTELRRYNASNNTTELVKNTQISPNSASPSLLTVSDSLMYFFVKTELTTELWRSDGTSSGTQFVREIPLVDFDSPIRNVETVGSKLFFTADTRGASDSEELWVSDGTSQGTVELYDFEQSGSFNSPTSLVALDNRLLFSGVSSGGSRELWISDGTVLGTRELVNIDTGVFDNSRVSSLTKRAGEVLFIATGNGLNDQLWKTDGTVLGTQLVKDLSSQGPGFIFYLTSTGDEAFFKFGDAVWRTDGTALGSVAVDSSSECVGDFYRYFTAINDKIMYVSRENGGESVLCKVENNTSSLVKNLYSSTGSDSIQRLQKFGDEIIFTARSGDGDIDLWKSDGTEAGTSQLKSINEDTLVTPALSNGLLFIVDAADYASDEPKGELWFTDGTVIGTEFLNINTATSSSVDIFLGNTATTTNSNRHYFNGVMSNGSQPLLSVTDGTAESTQLVDDIYAENMTPANGLVYFTPKQSDSNSANGVELWVANAQGATELSDINPGAGSSFPSLLSLAEDSTLYFRAFDGSSIGLWKYTEAQGVELVREGFTAIVSLSVVNNVIYMAADNGSDGVELWHSDGTGSGTNLLKDIWSGTESSSPSQFTSFGDIVVFNAVNSTERGLWKTDGTEAGTVFLENVFLEDYDNHQQGVFNGELFFVGYDDSTGSELWKTDGTSQGTVLVKDIRPSLDGESPYIVGVYQQQLILLADDGSNGYELWRSDGTNSGTEMVKDINPNGDGVDTALIEGNIIYLLANDNVHGLEIWRSDATLSGTLLLKDINSGEESSFYYPIISN